VAVWGMAVIGTPVALGTFAEPASSLHMDKNSTKRSSFGPVLISAAVAVVGLLALVLVDHGPWNKPQVQSETMVQFGTTAAAAQAAGATVSETAPKPVLEPVAPGPKPAQPAIPEQSKS
jgi:hypothetical protein